MAVINYMDRLTRLQLLLKDCGCDAFLIEDPVDLYYLSGLELSKGTLMVDLEGAYLFVDARYSEACKESAFFEVESDLAIDAWLGGRQHLSTIGFDPASMTCLRYSEWHTKLEALSNAVGRRYEFVSSASPVKDLRRIKDADEVAFLAEAAAIGSLGYDFLLTLLQEGVTESFLATELDIFWRRKGSDGLAFDPIIAFGANTSKPHYRSRDIPLKLGDTVLIDIGVKWKHYHSDMTRTLFFGAPTAKMKDIYAVVLEAQLHALSLCRPGCPIDDLDDAARQVIAAHGYGEYFTHRLGHGIGLEIHEAPSIKKSAHFSCLEEGMVITVEPGIYLPSIGGVRIEDSVQITSDGYRNLTNRPKELLIKI